MNLLLMKQMLGKRMEIMNYEEMDSWWLNVVNKEELNRENWNSITNYSFVLYLMTWVDVVRVSKVIGLMMVLLLVLLLRLEWREVILPKND